MWKTVIFLGCAFGTLYATPVGLKNMPIGDEQQNNEKTEVAMSTLNLPSNATSIRADISDEFTCENKTYGYYADVDNDCQIFHVCLPVTYPDGKENTFRWSFICPEETLFSQESFTCVREVDMNFNCDESERFYELNRNFGINPDSSIEMTSLESSAGGYERRHDESSTKKVISHKTTKPTNSVDIPQRRPLTPLVPELKPKVQPAPNPKPSLKEHEVPIPIYVRRPQPPKEAPLVPVAVKTLEEGQTEMKEETSKDNDSVEKLSTPLVPNMENPKTENLPDESQTIKYEFQPTTDQSNMIPEESETQKTEEISKTEEILSTPIPTESEIMTDTTQMVKGVEQEMQLASSDPASISVLQPEQMDTQTEMSLKLDTERNTEDMLMVSTSESLMEPVEKQESLTPEEQKTIIVENISNLINEESSKTPEVKEDQQLAEEFVMLGEKKLETTEKSEMNSLEDKEPEIKKVEEEVVDSSVGNTDTAEVHEIIPEIKLVDSLTKAENEVSELKEATPIMDKVDMEEPEMITEKTDLEKDKMADMDTKVIKSDKSEESVPKLAENAKVESDKSSQEVVNDIKNILQSSVPDESSVDKETVVLTYDPIDVESLSIKEGADKILPSEEMVVETNPMFLKEELNALTASASEPITIDKIEHIPAKEILPPLETNPILKDEVEKITDTIINESDEAIVVEKSSDEIQTPDIKEEPIKTEDIDLPESDEKINEAISQELMHSTAEEEKMLEGMNVQPMTMEEHPESNLNKEITEMEIISDEPLRTEPETLPIQTLLEKLDEVPLKVEENTKEEMKMETNVAPLNENIEEMQINEKTEATSVIENMDLIQVNTNSMHLPEKTDSMILNEKTTEEKVEHIPSEMIEEPKEQMSDQPQLNTNEEATSLLLKSDEPLSDIVQEKIEIPEEMSTDIPKLGEPIEEEKMNDEIMKKTLETDPMSEQPQQENVEMSSPLPELQSYVEPNNEPSSNLVKSHTFSVEEESPITLILDEIVNEVVAAVQNEENSVAKSSIEPEPISVSSETKVELKTEPIVEEPVEKHITEEKQETLPNEFEMERRHFPDPDPNPVDENTSSNLETEISKFPNSNLETSDMNAVQQSEVSARSLHRRMDPRKRRFLFRSESHSR